MAVAAVATGAAVVWGPHLRTGGIVSIPRRHLATTFLAFLVGAVVLPLAQPLTAAAEPAGFPDINAFQPVEPSSYIAGKQREVVAFTTPDGLQCAWAARTGPEDHVSVGCAGRLPGLPDSAPVGDTGCTGVGVPSAMPNDLSPYGLQQNNCPVLTAPLLAAGHKLTASNITCLVGADRLTACIDPILNRGFVLQPSGSWVF